MYAGVANAGSAIVRVAATVLFAYRPVASFPAHNTAHGLGIPGGQLFVVMLCQPPSMRKGHDPGYGPEGVRVGDWIASSEKTRYRDCARARVGRETRAFPVVAFASTRNRISTSAEGLTFVFASPDVLRSKPSPAPAAFFSRRSKG